MMQQMQRTIIQFMRFCVVGVSNTAIDFLVYFILTRGFNWGSHHRPLANIIGFLVATVNSYIWNKHWTFGNASNQHHILFTKFFVVSGSAFFIYTSLFAWLVNFGFNDLLIKLGLTGIILVWNFSLSRLWAFRARSSA